MIALTPVFPPLYLLAFGALHLWKTVPLEIRWILLGFAITQVVAAAFTPQPFLSIVLATVRATFISALVVTGFLLRDTARLQPMIWGYLLLFVTSMLAMLHVYGVNAIYVRLSHPYYTPISLGLGAVVCVWLLSGWVGGRQWQRVGLISIALGVLLASGSRGPVLALAAGSTAAFVLAQRRMTINLVTRAPVRRFGWGVLGAASVILLILWSRGGNIIPLARFWSLDLSGRDDIWAYAVQAFMAYPLGGVGPYQLGPYLTPQFTQACSLWDLTHDAGISCPTWLQPLYGSWITAHNGLLHHLGEAGLIGVFGLVALLALCGWAAVKSRQGMAIAVFTGFLAMNTVDVVTAVPSLHLAELFWVVMGMSLARLFNQSSASLPPNA